MSLEIVRRLVLPCALAGIAIPTLAFSASPFFKPRAPQTATLTAAPVEVALTPGNRMTCSLRSANGDPLAGTEVTLVYDGVSIASPITDEQGSFSVASLRAGVYTAKIDKWRVVLRAWSPGTAPEKAISNPVLTVGAVQRGQN